MLLGIAQLCIYALIAFLLLRIYCQKTFFAFKTVNFVQPSVRKLPTAVSISDLQIHSYYLYREKALVTMDGTGNS